MIDLYHKVCDHTSERTTKTYSTSFSLGIYLLSKRFRQPIYNIYGFVRFADEIVDTFHGHDQARLLRKFRSDTYEAITDGISLNPILHSFQKVVNEYGIEHELVNTFLDSMAMDLKDQTYNPEKFQQYILGSAEVVGLMCLHVFTEGDKTRYQKLRPYAMALGSAFQKINFLRDLRHDAMDLGRNYFPDVDVYKLDDETKQRIQDDIHKDFDVALQGIMQLPRSSRFGVYVAYTYYYQLFLKIKRTPAHRVLRERIRIPNLQKYALLFNSYIKHSANLF
ncbi:MAG: phytoene/squalene synthase family protein [Flavobacteriales bacterium]|nr:phytoene/squalene synthase family protein [Flavobacteriales bacterium]